MGRELLLSLPFVIAADDGTAPGCNPLLQVLQGLQAWGRLLPRELAKPWCTRTQYT